jgi:hypothetical protein
MTGPQEDDQGQLSRASDDRGRTALLNELGLRPSALVQSDALIIVEGNSDESTLRSLFPIELSRCRFVVTGGVNEVMTACRSLETIEQVVPWICIRDRDFLDDEERDGLLSAHKNLFIWESRMLENVLLDPELISETFIRSGFNKSPIEVLAFLREAAESGKEEVLHQLVQKRLVALPSPDRQRPETGLEKLRMHYSSSIETMNQRLAAFDEVAAEVKDDLDHRWDSRWQILTHGKRLFADVVKWGPFGSKEHLTNALAATFTHKTLHPTQLVNLGSEIRMMLSS